jgi:hypothetical protein
MKQELRCGQSIFGIYAVSYLIYSDSHIHEVQNIELTADEDR